MEEVNSIFQIVNTNNDLILIKDNIAMIAEV